MLWEKEINNTFGGMHMFINEEKRTVDIVNSKHEMLEKLQELRISPQMNHRNKIYILSKDVNEFHALTRDDQIEIVTTHGIRSFIKTLLFKETPIEKVLCRMNLPPTESRDYKKAIKNGSIVLVSGSDPFNEHEWTGHTLNKWITNQSNASNLINWDVKDIRVVPFHSNQEVHMAPEMAVAGEFGRASDEGNDEIPLKDNQRYVRDPKTKELSIYQGPHN